MVRFRYRAVHLIVRIEGRPVEIQVRTQVQHAWAQLVEQLAGRYGQSLKYGKGEAGIQPLLQKLAASIASLEQLESAYHSVADVAGGLPRIRSLKADIMRVAGQAGEISDPREEP